MTRRALLHVRLGLGPRMALAGSVASLLAFALATASWLADQNDRLARIPAQEAATVEAAGRAFLAARLDVRLPEVGAAAAAAARAATVQVALRHDLKRRARREAGVPDLARLARGELALTDLDAAWTRTGAGEPDLLPRAALVSGAARGACLLEVAGRGVALAVCAEVEVGEALDGTPLLAGGARIVSLAGLPGPARLVLRRDSKEREVAVTVDWAAALEAGGRVREAGVVHAAGLVLQVPVARPTQVRALDLLGAVPSVAADAWRAHLAWTLPLLAGLHVALILLAAWISRGFAPVLRSARRLGAGDLSAGERLSRRDEIGVLAAVLSDLGGSLRAAQGAFERTARVEAWRESVRSIAHEIGNPLLPLRATIENLRRWRAEDPRRFDEAFESRTAALLSEVDQLARLASGLRQAAATPAPVPAALDLSGLCREVASLQQAAAPAVTIRVTAEGDGAPATADAGQVRQVLVNVIQNAVQALGGAGEVHVRVAVTPGSHSVCVEDSGPGADDATLARLFDLGFTTRRGSGGSGLGLWLARRIAEGHGGSLDVGRSPLGGLAFTLTLPRT